MTATTGARRRTLLAGHRLFVTRDLDEARMRIADRFCEHYLGLTHRDGRLDTEYNTVSVGEDVSLNYLRYGDEVRITPGTFNDFFLVQIPLAGTARVKVGDAMVASDCRIASIGSPTEPVDMVWSDGCEQLLVYIRRGAVEELVARTPGESRTVVFQPRFDLRTPAATAWLRLIQLAVDDIDEGGALLASDLVSAHFQHTVIAGLLAAQSTVGAPAPVAAAGSRTVRRVVELMEATPQRQWRLAELAEHAGVSARSLQEGFRRELGASPTEQLRRIRLRRARRDLLRRSHGPESVASVAARWGFGHLGRFAEVYRAEYDELPSETLSR